MESKTVGRVPNRAAVGWKSPNNSISSTSSSSTSDEISTFSSFTTSPTKSVKAPTPKSSTFNHQNFHTIANHKISNRQNEFQIDITQKTFQGVNNGNINCKKSPLLRRMKLALAEAEEQSTNQDTETFSYHSPVKFSSLNSTNQNSITDDSTNQNSWQNSTRKGTVKADEDFEFKGFPKPPPHFFPPPPTLTTQTVPIPVNSPPGQQDSPPKKVDIDFQDHPPVEIKRIPLIFKAPSPKSPDYKNEKTCVLDELKQKQELGIGTGSGNGPIYKKNRSPMLRRMKLALAHIENESDL